MLRNKRKEGAQKNTLVGIITYNPDLGTLVELISSLAAQNCDIFVFDNASRYQEQIAITLAPWENVTVSQSGSNVGLASAANNIFQIAKKKLYEFVILFDQDSVPAIDYVETLVSLFRGTRKIQSDKVAAISGVQRCRFSGQNAPFVRYSFLLPEKIFPSPGGDPESIDFLITSGCLFPLSAISEIGAFDESLFIDNVDVEWCSRARDLGYKLLGSDNTWFSHSIGDDVYRAFGRIVARKHSPIRSYYSVRNMLALCRRRYVNNVWKANAVIRAVLKSVFMLIISGERKEYARQIFKALKDANQIAATPKYNRIVG